MDQYDIMSNPDDDDLPEGAVLTAYIAESEEAANADSAQVTARIPAYDISKSFGPMTALPRTRKDGTQILPSRGDDCLISFDEDGEPQLVSWFAVDDTMAPQDGFASGLSIADLYSKVNPLDVYQDEWGRISEKYGSNTASALGGVAPGTAEAERAFTGLVEPFAAVAGDMRVTINPGQQVWWKVEADLIAFPTELAWVRCDFKIQLIAGGINQTTDARGRIFGPQLILSNHGSVGWQGFSLRALYKCNPGQVYVAAIWASVQTGTTWRYWHGGTYLSIRSHVVGFW